ncbi:MAG: GDSL-type esterase/lipase family protein [Oscillospiraceae bacterium]
MTDFNKLNFGVDGDSITAGEQWSFHVFKNLGLTTHHNVAVGSSVWYKRTIEVGGKSVTTQNYSDADFAGISGGWEPTEDAAEMQMRANNCAVVHIQKFLAEVESGEYPAPDIFAFAMGTNDAEDCIGDAEKALTGKNIEGNDNIDLFTEAGAMRWCIQTILEHFPECRVFVLTPLQTAMHAHNAKIVKQMDTMRRICQGMSVQMIDCYSNSGICEMFENEGAEGRYLIDGLHPKDNGRALQGAFVTKEIRGNYF